MNQELFIKNRNKIMDLMEDNSILISFNRPKSGDVFKQTYDENRNFFYLTGILEFEDIVILKKVNTVRSEMILINPYDELKAKWVGAPKSKKEITEISGIKSVFYLGSYKQIIDQLLTQVDKVYLDNTPMNTEYLTDDLEYAKLLKDAHPFIQILDGRKLFTKARTVKEEAEINEMKKAISITNEGIKNILKHIKPGLYEYQLESYFDQAVKFNGGTGYAFPTIAASGANATCLHYQENNSIMNDGDLILFDLGSSVNMYCSDISRTFPVNGKFTDRQKLLYNIVLEAQQVAFDNAKPGITTRELNNKVREFYAKKLKEIGLIKNGTDDEVSLYYYHGVSHHIGLDCHDLCEYTPLKPGCIISNEPGLYIASENIGIRIEDDILITETGAEWLSKDIIKTVEDIEKFIEENRVNE